MKPLANESWLATGTLLTHVLYGGPFPTFKIAGLECSLPFYWERQNASEKEHASGTSRPWNAELFWVSRWRLSVLVNETATARLRVYKKPLLTSGGFGVCQRGPRWPAWVITRGLAPAAPRWQIPLPTSTVESGFLSECQYNPKYIFFFKKNQLGGKLPQSLVWKFPVMPRIIWPETHWLTTITITNSGKKYREADWGSWADHPEEVVENNRRNEWERQWASKWRRETGKVVCTGPQEKRHGKRSRVLCVLGGRQSRVQILHLTHSKAMTPNPSQTPTYW